MIIINGSQGEGGGQILRTALSLAAILGKEVHFEQIRANRKKPGLMRQHLTCATAVAEISEGTLDGAELTSQELTFKPGHIHGGNFHFSIGSAGNTILLAQTVLPILLMADKPSEVILDGGTYNTTDCPSFDFFERVFLPCLHQMGADINVNMERIGFCPAGGGRVVLSIKPLHNWQKLSLCERGELKEARVTSLGCAMDQSILRDEIRFFQEELATLLPFKGTMHEVNATCTGNFLYSELIYENITELFGICGNYGVSRKVVAKRVAGLTRQYLQNNWVVGPFLADQLLLPLALGAGGRFLTGKPTLHAETNRDIIRQFLDVDIRFTSCDNGMYVIEVNK